MISISESIAGSLKKSPGLYKIRVVTTIVDSKTVNNKATHTYIFQNIKNGGR
jgi:hypothetical protein